MTRKQQIILIIPLALVFLILYIFNSDNRGLEPLIRKYNYDGLIIKKFINTENHNNPTIKLNTKEQITVFTDAFYTKALVGDSLFKAKDSLYMLHYRNGYLVDTVELMKSEGFR